MKFQTLCAMISGLLLLQLCYASNDNAAEKPQTEISPLIQGVKNAISSTPYAALIIHTRVDIIPVPDVNPDDDYAEEKQIYHATVLETYRGQKRKNISYTMTVEKGEAAIINRSPVVVTLCKSNDAFFWPGTGSRFSGTEEVTRTSRLTGQSIELNQQSFPYCE